MNHVQTICHNSHPAHSGQRVWNSRDRCSPDGHATAANAYASSANRYTGAAYSHAGATDGHTDAHLTHGDTRAADQHTGSAHGDFRAHSNRAPIQPHSSSAHTNSPAQNQREG